MPRDSSLVLATDREVQHAKPRGDRAEFRIKGCCAQQTSAPARVPCFSLHQWTASQSEDARQRGL